MSCDVITVWIHNITFADVFPAYVVGSIYQIYIHFLIIFGADESVNRDNMTTAHFTVLLVNINDSSVSWGKIWTWRIENSGWRKRD